MKSLQALTSVERLVEARALLASGEARRIRLASGISQGKMAAELGVSVSAIHRWERGERVPRGRAATDYAALLLRLRGMLESRCHPAN
ncbi:helix-turn-helix domain-containing protein [Geodermatophilus africanus]|uniref:helix-turn-helix domain-containing protein n=1 Tax=Geodermatophilus africanus TaxID=1137993 RepID=UPI00147DDB9F|nr:helix-turn-helix transcriptional regulator [Geodermatophilus africanus]